MPPRWSSGDAVLLREPWRGKVWTARPMRVVIDTPELIALHMVPGTICKHPISISGGPVAEFLPDEWRLIDRPWSGGDMLCLHQPGTWCAIKLFWSPPPQRRFLRWYINLQEPLRRTVNGFDYLDQELDLIIEADRTWHWKDEVEFQSAIARGRIPAERERILRDAGEEVLSQMRSGGWFAMDWKDWIPPTWARLELMKNWDELER